MKQARIGLLALAATLVLAGCAAMMMGGGGGYEPPADTCTRERQNAGLCKAK